jgi:putative transposase
VVRNGYHQQRDVVTGAGAVTVTAPRVNDKRVNPETKERQRFSSKILPAWSRKSPRVAEVLPLLYLHGLSSLDFAPELEQFLGSGAGLSAATVTRLTTQWQDEAKPFGNRNLSQVDFVYLSVDGIGLKVRMEQEKLCLLVMIGVRADGRKELVALTDGYRESPPSTGRVCSAMPSGAGPGAGVGVLGVGVLGVGVLGVGVLGRHCGTCSRRPGSSGAGSTSRRMCLPRCRSRPTPGQSRRCRRSTTPRTPTTPGPR